MQSLGLIQRLGSLSEFAKQPEKQDQHGERTGKISNCSTGGVRVNSRGPKDDHHAQRRLSGLDSGRDDE